MSLFSKIRTVFRGEIPFYYLPHEFMRRRRAAVTLAAESSQMDKINVQPARLASEFVALDATELVHYFRERITPRFWSDEITIHVDEKSEIIRTADKIVEDSSWELMGFGVLRFDQENVWRRDPLSGHDWGIEHHADTPLFRNDGSDIRVLWELNRFAHAVTLALAYSATRDEKYAETFFAHVESWTEQDPYARGANWGCAMEVALRAVNLLAAFDIFRRSASLNEKRLAMMLRLFDQHGRFIVDNSEFSYIATSNHYLSDVVGLFWIGTMMPELEKAAEWREFGLNEMLSEMDKQVLPDGVDFEASTGYHLFVTEMFNASLLLVKRNGVDIESRYWETLDAMFDYLRAITRLDVGMPLVGDCDGSRFLPILSEPPAIAGGSDSFPNAGIYILRDDDLYLHFNASDCGVNGRGSHGHNDALSIEVSVFARAFIVDPGSYVYNLDLEARHQFRSTAYHSTVMVDGVEQNTSNFDLPFVIGNEAAPQVIEWTSTETNDLIVAEHYGYRRLKSPVTHRRSVEFNKTEGYWLINDQLTGSGEHEFIFTFHVAPELSVEEDEGTITITDDVGRSLLIVPVGIDTEAILDDAFFSPAYGRKEASYLLKWVVTATPPFDVKFVLVPCEGPDNRVERLELALRLADNK